MGVIQININPNTITPRSVIGKGIENGFKKLIEEKHLYQSIEIDIRKIEIEAQEYQEGGMPFGGGETAYDTVSLNWICPTSNQAQMVAANRVGSMDIRFNSPKVKLFCKKCKREEPFFPIENHASVFCVALGVQIFVLGYKCQSCELPELEMFMVKRDQAKLTLCGRSPMEHIATSKAFPREHARFISDALITYHAGKTLAGLFFLRTFIEQYVVKKTGKRIDENALEEYQKQLPNSLKPIIPSLTDIYTQLSNEIHAANANTDLFDDALKKMESHFEFLKAG